MTKTTSAQQIPEVAYYYPEPYWSSEEGDRLKSLLLFFDKIAILLPRYMRGRERAADPAIAGAMIDQKLLIILEPEKFIDQQMAEELTGIMLEMLEAGVFDDLSVPTDYHAMSMSRVGRYHDSKDEIADELLDELKRRRLAFESQDGVSVPMHPEVRETILILLSQLARSAGHRHGLSLHPTTTLTRRTGAWPLESALDEFISMVERPAMPSAGHVVALDLETVGLNLETVPLDEVVSFRMQHGSQYRQYARNVRQFVLELSMLPEAERATELYDRREQLADLADELRRSARKAWRRSLAPFSIGAVGAAWTAGHGHDMISAVLAFSGTLLSLQTSPQPTAAAYSYIFAADREILR